MSDSKISIWSFYDPNTGMLTGRHFSGLPELLGLNTPDGNHVIEGHHDHRCRRVDLQSGKVVAWQPPKPSEEHEWNPADERWQLSAAALKKRELIARISALETAQPRAVRDALLGRGLDRLREIDDQIAKLRAQIS